jgi:hypothetical protein
VSYFLNQRNRIQWIFLSATLLGSASVAGAQSASPGWIAAPLAGLLANPEMTEVRAIQGVPGSATVSGAIRLPAGILKVHLAPAQGWALVEQAPARTLGLLPFAGLQPGGVALIDNALSAPDIVSFSPGGRSAAIVSNAAGMVQVLTGLDRTPTVAMQTGISGLGVIGAAAISDDGTLTAVLTSEGRVFLLSATQAPQLIFQAGSPAGMTFLPAQQALAIADGAAATISVLDGLNRTPFIRSALPGPNLSGAGVLVRASGDAQSLFVAARGGTSAYRIDFANRSMSTLEVPASLSQMERLPGGDIFLFSANPGEAAWLLWANGTNLSASFAQPTEEPRVRRTAQPRTAR